MHHEAVTDEAVTRGRTKLQQLYEDFRRLVDAGLNDAAITRGRAVLVEYLEALRWLAAGADVNAAADLQRTTPSRVRELRAALLDLLERSPVQISDSGLEH